MRSSPAWRLVGRADPKTLVPPRLQLHHAAQLVSEVGRSYLFPRADDSHSGFVWAADDWMMCEPIPAREPVRFGLFAPELALALFRDGGAILAELYVAGHTEGAARDWIRRSLGEVGLDPARFSTRKPYELPPHPLDEGEPFHFHPAECFDELARYWGNADLMLRQVSAENPGASDVRVWPHHFDIGLLIVLDLGEGGKGAKSIGVGLSPGDCNYAEPYFYVNLNPAPKVKALPRLEGGGIWHTEGWTGAVLTGSAIVADRSVEEQEARARKFLKSAVRAARDLLGR